MTRRGRISWLVSVRLLAGVVSTSLTEWAISQTALKQDATAQATVVAATIAVPNGVRKMPRGAPSRFV